MPPFYSLFVLCSSSTASTIGLISITMTSGFSNAHRALVSPVWRLTPTSFAFVPVPVTGPARNRLGPRPASPLDAAVAGSFTALFFDSKDETVVLSAFSFSNVPRLTVRTTDSKRKCYSTGFLSLLRLSCVRFDRSNTGWSLSLPE